MPRRRDREADIKSGMQQRWTVNSYARTHSDQFGFVIHYGRMYRLEHRGETIVTVNTIDAAKMISTIYLNDMILSK